MSKPAVIVIHPLVLLSVVDHYNRLAKQQKNFRVVGVLLGEQKSSGVIDVSNCYAIPFEEDPKDSNIWYLDHIYNETLYTMYRKININEKIVGWYATGVRIKQNDIQINQIFQQYTPNPIFVIIDVNSDDPIQLPTEAYMAVDEVTKSGEIFQNFIHLPSTVQAIEPEEIGVEQLLREMNTISGHSLTSVMQQKFQALQGMTKKIQQIQKYLRFVTSHDVTPNQVVMSQLQEILNYLPNLVNENIIRAFTTKNNDNMHAIYLATMVRSIIALHSLINNQIANKEQDKLQDQKIKQERAKQQDTKVSEKKDENAQ